MKTCKCGNAAAWLLDWGDGYPITACEPDAAELLRDKPGLVSARSI